VADCLSRIHDKTENIKHENVDRMIHDIKNLPMSPKKISQFTNESKTDVEIKALVSMCNNGWAQTVDEVPQHIKKYWSMKNDLKRENELLFFNYKLVVPKSLQNYVMSKVHMGHQGETRCKLLSRKHFYWTSMSKDIEMFVKSCVICQTHANACNKQPLHPYVIPDRPFEQVSVNIAYVNGND